MNPLFPAFWHGRNLFQYYKAKVSMASANLESKLVHIWMVHQKQDRQHPTLRISLRKSSTLKRRMPRIRASLRKGQVIFTHNKGDLSEILCGPYPCPQVKLQELDMFRFTCLSAGLKHCKYKHKGLKDLRLTRVKPYAVS